MIKHEENNHQSYFLRYAKDITSQNGEDGIIQRIFEIVSPSSSPYLIDVGAWDGKHLSNTYSLLKNHQWNGILIEADENRVNDMIKLYENNNNVICLNKMIQFDGNDSLPSLLSNSNSSKDIDFISIDIDGCDYHIWKSLKNSVYKAKVVCIEFNPTIPHCIHFIQEPDFRIYQGSSLLAIKSLGNEMGYSLIACTTFNAFFLRNDLLPLLNEIKDYDGYINDIDKLHSQSMVTHMFQLYDGEIRYTGVKKLLWHRVAMNPQSLQIISKKNRIFPFAPKQSFRTSMDKITDILKDILEAYENKDKDKKVINILIKEKIPIIIDICKQHIAVSHLTAIIIEILNNIIIIILSLKIDKNLIFSTIGLIRTIYSERSMIEKENVNIYLYPLVYIETIMKYLGNYDISLLKENTLRLSQVCRVKEDMLEALYHCNNLNNNINHDKELEKEIKRIQLKSYNILRDVIKQFGGTSYSNSLQNITTNKHSKMLSMKIPNWYHFGYIITFSIGLLIGLKIKK